MSEKSTRIYCDTCRSSFGLEAHVVVGEKAYCVKCAATLIATLPKTADGVPVVPVEYIKQLTARVAELEGAIEKAKVALRQLINDAKGASDGQEAAIQAAERDGGGMGEAKGASDE